MLEFNINVTYDNLEIQVYSKLLQLNANEIMELHEIRFPVRIQEWLNKSSTTLSVNELELRRSKDNYFM